MLKRILTGRAGTAAQRAGDSTLLGADLFLRTLMLERRRTERSGRAFVLMIVEAGWLLKTENGLEKILRVLQSVRDTDVKGWYEDRAAIGVIFTELGSTVEKAAVRTLATRVMDALHASLSIQEINEIRLSFHVFPEDWDDNHQQSSPKSWTLRLALTQEVERKRGALHVKRLIDIAGSVAAMVFLLPVMLLIALVIKATSRGPVLFRQVRVGHHGKKFTFLKFRSMYVNNDASIHEAYVKAFIAGSAEAQPANGEAKIFKLATDPRVTPIGRILRKTSLDELPQFLNVLSGEMSLVGPRPPLPYEAERYSLWHRRRLQAVKPGITGLWQVEGRSRVTFDEMVRLDIRYARTWSLWLDLKILAQTPQAVITGSGAC
jgi:exopolysaccharide biosynthesis polyprenyl glycosylphosphotransferase